MVRVLANVLNLPHAQHEGERRPLAQRGASPFFSTIFLSIALSSHRLGQQRRLASESRGYKRVSKCLIAANELL
jgi:hypothetical protein